MAISERLALLVTLDSRGALKGFDDVGKAANKNIGKTTSKLDSMGRSFTTAGVGMVATGAVVAGGLFKMAQASEEAKLSVVKLENSLANNAGLAGSTADEFIELAQAIQGKTAADGDSIVAGVAVLAQGKVNAAQIKELTPLVVDLARKKGIDEVAAFTLASKAVAGNAGALKRSGIVVDEAAFKTDAYGATVDALSSAVGGFAEEEGKTFAGSIERLKNEMGDLAEGVGVGVVDAFSSMLGVVDPLLSTFTGLDPAVQGTVGKFAAFGTAGLIAAGVTSTLIGSLIKMRANFVSAADGIGKLIGKMAGLRLATVGVVGGLVAVAAAVGLALWNKSQEGAQRYTSILKGLRAEAEATGDTFTEITLRNLAEGFATAGGQEALRRLGTSVGEIGTALQGTDAEWEAFKDSLNNTDDAFAGAYVGQLDLMRDGIDGAAAEQKNLETGLKEAGVATDGLTGLTGELVTELTAEEQAAKDAAAAIDDLSNKIATQFNEATNALEAQINYEKGIRALNDSLKEGGNSFNRNTEAGEKNSDMLLAARSTIDEVMQATLDQVAATEGLVAGQEAAIAAGEFYIGNLKDQLTQAGLTEQQIADLVAEYSLAPPKVTTVMSADTAAATQAVRNYVLALMGIKAAVLEVNGVEVKANGELGFVIAPFREHGGPVSGGKPYIVGERGPELFVPSSSGNIIANGGTSAGVGQTIVVKIGDEVVARVVANAGAVGKRRGIG